MDERLEPVSGDHTVRASSICVAMQKATKGHAMRLEIQPTEALLRRNVKGRGRAGGPRGPDSKELARLVRLKTIGFRSVFRAHPMVRLLSIVLLASLLAAFVSAGTSATRAESSPGAALSQTRGNPGGSMAAMGCGACVAMGACIASAAPQSAGPAVAELPPRQSLFRRSNQACAPDTAPPKPSSL